MMRLGSLFAGIGGFDLAARWMGWTTAWYSEIDPYACSIMARHFPEAVNLGDITKIHHPPRVDILCGGFPCQDISVAGKGAGLEGARSGLWSEYARIIEEGQPDWVVIENSPMLRKRGLARVLTDLHALGYDAEWHCIPASAVGASHRRDRIWIIAYPRSAGRQGLVTDDRIFSRPGASQSLPGYAAFRGRLAVALNSDSLRAGDGLSLAVHRRRLRCLGNAVVPVIPYLIFQAIQDVHTSTHR